MSDWMLNIFIVFAIIGGFIVFHVIRKRQLHGSVGRAHILETYTRDWTREAAEGSLDPVVGREDEIERVIHILARRRKNNPLLIGEPGVGKTAIIEGLALRIHKGEVPHLLQGKRVLALDLSSMVSGTKFRGELEERMRHLMKEIEDLRRSVILFVDEIHVIEQLAGAEGSMNVSDILKPALARGDLQAVGATTWKEYEQYIKPDHALERRFQPVLVGEPSDKEAISILQGLRGTYEEFHGVQISDGALESAVTLSSAMKDRFLPDKAIDLIDEACAKIAIEASGHHRVMVGALHSAARKVCSENRPTVTRKDVQDIVKEWMGGTGLLRKKHRA